MTTAQYKEYVDKNVNSVSSEVKETKVSSADFVKAIERAFDSANKKFYNNELERPVITIAPDMKKRTYGHLTIGRVWHKGDVSKVELNIVPNMVESHLQIAGTLLHEMAHLFNLQHGIKDCSGNGNFYHNKFFGETANAHGLALPKDEKYGWCGHALNEQGKAWADSIKDDLAGLVRDTSSKVVAKKSKTYRYVCPICGAKCYSTKRIGIICETCEEKMTCVNEDEE